MRKTSPFNHGTVHFVGIGGIGMSGIAEVMLNLGYEVQGSDIKPNPNTERLEKRGAKIIIGHHSKNVEGCAAVIISTAIKSDNPEVNAARAHAIPVVRRADMLAELIRLKWSVAVAGTHGKTTTTSMVAALLDGIGLDPTVINGGVINAYDSNAKLGGGDWMVVEADESDGTFTKLRASIGVVTNINCEHMDYYGGMENLRKAFDTFIENLPFYGFAVLCIDHPEVQSLVSRIPDRRRITYGLNAQADYRAVNLVTDHTGAQFDLIIRQPGENSSRCIDKLNLPMAGYHNVQNALAALVVALELGGDEVALRKALANFGGVKRRFSLVGEWNNIKIIDDYGHHPVEINAVLKAARAMQGDKRIIAVVQPHRFSRLQDLFEDFCKCLNTADQVIIAPVFAAGETPIEGVSGENLAKAIREHGHKGVSHLDDLDALPTRIRELAQPTDMVICFGAGDITRHANILAKALES